VAPHAMQRNHEGIHNRMELINRQAYAFRNSQKYRMRVQVLCGGSAQSRVVPPELAESLTDLSGPDNREGGARGGIRTHDIQNHNLALLPAELHAPQHLDSSKRGAI
jgi:hypothetical protein